MDKNDRFDRRLQLGEIFTAKDLARIERALSGALKCEIAIVVPDGAKKTGNQRVAVPWELEPVAYLVSREATSDQLKGASTLLVLLLKEAVRYRMTAELHLETVRADYHALQEKHAALERSETRYRELSRKLEDQVAAQVLEIKEAQRKMFLSEKLASVGQLAAGVAHELNTPLAYIRNNLVAARGYLDDLESLFAAVVHGKDLTSMRASWEQSDIDYIRSDFPLLLDACLDGVTRLASIVSDLKIFSNINKMQQSMDDVNGRLATVLSMLKPQIGDRIEIEQVFADLPAILCYPAHLGQALYNLLQNAVQAIEGKGKVGIRTFTMDGHVGVAIADTGAGIREEDISRIYDPFFTTKVVGQGIGLGLSVVHDVVKAHHGRIEVESQPGKGTSFTILLPIEPTKDAEDGE